MLSNPELDLSQGNIAFVLFETLTVFELLLITCYLSVAVLGYWRHFSVKGYNNI